MSKKKQGPRVLIWDVETKPIKAYVWALYDQTVGLNQIDEDWSLLSFAAKWLDDPADKMIYADQRFAKNVEDDKALCQKLWKLLDEADVVVTFNGKNFDVPKVFARFATHGLPRPSGFKHYDVLEIVKRNFKFTSNRLEYVAAKLNKKFRKFSSGRKFEGFSLWLGCMEGNKAAWVEMAKYNPLDVLATEELYLLMRTWDSGGINFSWFNDAEVSLCQCGSKKFQKRGYAYTSVGKFHRYQCQGCGAWSRGRENLFSKEKRASLRVGTRD